MRTSLVPILLRKKPAAGSSVFISDSFNRVDSASPGNADTGQAWLQESSGSTFTMRIVSGKLLPSASGTGCQVISDPHTTNVSVQADITPSTAVHWVLMRGASTASVYQNHNAAIIQNGNLRLVQLAGGVFTDLGTGFPGLDTSGATTYTVKLSVDGANNFTVWLNGVSRVTGTDATYAGNTFVGVRTSDATGVFDNFSLSTP